jgi:hypothetical protein
MRLNALASVRSVLAQLGQWTLPSSDGSRWSARHRSLQFRQSTRGSVKFSRWPEAAQIFGDDRMAASRPTTSWRNCTIERHHASLTLRSMSTPRGP